MGFLHTNALSSLLAAALCAATFQAAYADVKDGRIVIANDDLNLSRPLPQAVYRADTRTPDQIFQYGFGARGNSYNIRNHVIGGANLENTGFVSTTASREIATQIANSNRLELASACGASSDGQTTFTCRAFVYEIRATGNMIYLPDQLTSDLQRYAGQQEWAAIHSIDPRQIVRATEYRVNFVNNIPQGGATQVRVWDNVAGRGAGYAGYDPNFIGYDPDNRANNHGWSSTADVGPTSTTDRRCTSQTVATSVTRPSGSDLAIAVPEYCEAHGGVVLRNSNVPGGASVVEPVDFRNATHTGETQRWRETADQRDNDLLIDSIKLTFTPAYPK